MNRISKLFEKRGQDILSVYFTAGFPHLHSTQEIIRALGAAGADMIEIGIPFSDPMADGPVIQQSNDAALGNGISLQLLLKQVKEIRHELDTPLLLMGYLNPVLQYGMERFCHDAAAAGIDGIILPDLPPEIWEEQYAGLFSRYGLKQVFLVTQQTSNERIAYIDGLSDAFIYLVTTAAITGGSQAFTDTHTVYFSRIQQLSLKNPVLGGFGISNATAYREVCGYLNGAVIGSSFIRALQQDGDLAVIIHDFIKQIRS